MCLFLKSTFSVDTNYVEELTEEENNFLNKSILWEGKTPLLKSKLYKGLYFKNEGSNPAGSFKDRESSFVFKILDRYWKLNNKELLVVSSGNAAISAILYGNYFDTKVKVLVSRSIWSHKLDILRKLWANVEIVGDDYEETYRYVVENHDLYSDYINITAWISDWRDEANKLISYESVEQLWWKEIDYVIVPIWNGWCFWGVYKWFWEMKKSWLIDKIPYIIWVQVKNASPIDMSVQLWIENYEIWKGKVVDSVADGIVARESYCSPKVLEVIKRNHGEIITVDENEIKDWYEIFLKEWLLVEYTSAVVYSVYKKQEEKFSWKRVVAIITWNWQKLL